MTRSDFFFKVFLLPLCGDYADTEEAARELSGGDGSSPLSIAVPQGGGFTGGSEKLPETGYVLMVESTGLPDE